jgi:hypothetical protein
MGGSIGSDIGSCSLSSAGADQGLGSVSQAPAGAALSEQVIPALWVKSGPYKVRESGEWHSAGWVPPSKRLVAGSIPAGGHTAGGTSMEPGTAGTQAGAKPLRLDLTAAAMRS